GVGKGDHVAIMIPNTPHFPIIYYGILHVGATVVPLNCLLHHREVQYLLENSDAKAFFAWHAFSKETVPAFDETSSCRHFIDVCGREQAPPPIGESFTELMDAASADFDTVQTMPDDSAVILYTSGTTGHPKGAELTHFNMFFNALTFKDRIVRLRPDDVSLVVLPLFHSFGQTCVQNTSVLAGATMTMLDRFDARKAASIIKRDRVTYLAAVPSVYILLLNMRNLSAEDVGSLRLAVSGGASLPAETLAEFKERFGVQILEGYGLSETSPVASFNVIERPCKPASIGVPLWGAQMKVMRDDGAFAAPDEVGEIVIRGHNVMKQYYKQPVATEEAIVNGWFHTGDMAKVDDDGYFFIVDRKKDIIIRAGMNIYPREVEEVMHGHPAVMEVAVVGVPHKSHGEEVKAYVALRDGEEATPQELRDYCREHLAQFKCPKTVEILEALPKGPTGKILKRELRSKP
ncbi:MAG TPA: long-chain fatty acid--CoA ligase, partial [Candidatus Hydrogenedentes bacterium]|nr:long-chain fatty acid--CoA ligase [Candidatus Hydrogenedentota bacterium]